MTRTLFGTDGIRGTANSEPVTPATALKVAQAAALQFTRGNHRHRVVIGKDTRLSGYMLEPALTAGFTSMGMDVVLLGPMPTPAVAILTRSLRADLGIVISASHNPYADNGIKLFGPDGYKLSDAVEAAIEARIAQNGDWALCAPDELGRTTKLEDARGRYIEFVKRTFPKGLSLDGLKIVVDCANGAAYKVAPTVLWELGAEVVPLGVTPDGFNINLDCGATATAAMQSAVVAQGAHLGIALDGDADRVILADEGGQVIDGDQLMALVARSWMDSNRLRGGGVVATIMSNLGLERFIGGLGLALVRTPVGDRYVVERMRECGINVGGEQSGHIILSDHATTGVAGARGPHPERTAAERGRPRLRAAAAAAAQRAHQRRRRARPAACARRHPQRRGRAGRRRTPRGAQVGHRAADPGDGGGRGRGLGRPCRRRHHCRRRQSPVGVTSQGAT
jgi:phosphoglucosamine mutase